VSTSIITETAGASPPFALPPGARPEGFARAAEELEAGPIRVGFLTPAHRVRLERALTPGAIAARGYTSVSPSQCAGLGYAYYQRRSGLLVPRYPVLSANDDGSPRVGGSQLRSDRPRIHHGRPIKYESPQGQLNCIDAHPFVRPLLPKREIPLFLTEGIVKGDAAVSAGLCCLSLCGVWSWRGAVERGGAPVALPDFDALALRGRRVFIVFDADVMVKPAVHQSLVRLKPYLEAKGAEVRVIYLENGDLEDHFSA
jgi:hypothetical protein